jgi:osmotically-inducible protein OsmY
MTFFKRRAGVAAVASLLILAGWSYSGRAQQPEPREPTRRTGERIGEAVDRAARDIRDSVEDASRALRGKFREAKGAVDRMGIEARVYGRVHWDKALQAANLEVEMNEGGVAVLRGSVPDAAARTRALDLARQTVGVNQVTDELTVGSSGAATGTPAPAPTVRP